MNKCPGQDLGFGNPLTLVYEIECPCCENMVEFWRDDRKRTCSACGEYVQPDLEILKKYHGCASHCSMAQECLGDKNYLQLVLGERRSEQDGKKELEKILGLIPKGEEEAIDFLTQTIQKNLELGFLLDMETDIEPLREEQQELYEKVTKCLTEYAFRK